MNNFLEKLQIKLTPRFIRRIKRIEDELNNLNAKNSYTNSNINNKLLSIDSKLNNIININKLYYNKSENNNEHNIAIVRCTGNLNIGNEFINAGGIFLLKKIFNNSKFYYYEFFDTASTDNYKYFSQSLLEKDIKEIENKCDMMFVLSGSIISERAKNVLFELSKIKIHKVLLGASCLLYDENEKQLCLKLSNLYNEIFTRDNITYSFFDNSSNVYNGIDLAFFVNYISPANSQYEIMGGGGVCID